MASWGGDYSADAVGIDWRSLLVIVLLFVGLTLEALWVS